MSRGNMETVMDASSASQSFCEELLKASLMQDWETVRQLVAKEDENEREKTYVLEKLIMLNEWDVVEELMDMGVLNHKHTHCIGDRLVADRQWQHLFTLNTQGVVDLDFSKTAFESLSLDEKVVFVDELLKLLYVSEWSRDRKISRLLDEILSCCIQCGSTHFEMARRLLVRIGSPECCTKFYGECNLYQDKTHHIIVLGHIIRRENLEQFLMVLLSDGEATCTYFGFLMAAMLKKWDVVREMVQKHRHSNILCEMETFSIIRDLIPLGGESLKSAACLLQGMLYLSNFESDYPTSPFHGGLDSVRDVLTKVFVMYNTFGDPTQQSVFQQLIQICEELELYGVGAVVGIWGEEKDSLLPFLDRPIDFHSAQVVLKELMQADLWFLTHKFLKHHKEHRDMVLRVATAEMKERRGARMLVKQLMGTCRNELLLAHVLSKIIMSSDIELFHQFLAQDLIVPTHGCVYGLYKKPSFAQTFQHIFEKYIYDLAIYVTEHTLSLIIRGAVISPRHLKSVRKAYAMCRIAVERGLTTYLKASVPFETHTRKEAKEPLLFYQTVLLIQEGTGDWFLPVLDMLFKTGATDHAELYKCTSDSKLHNKFHDGLRRGGEVVKEYFNDIASKPRSLKDLARLVVSHSLGCRADRKVRALALGLPLALTQYVLFFDVCQDLY